MSKDMHLFLLELMEFLSGHGLTKASENLADAIVEEAGR